MEKRELTCINCPLGCRINVTLEKGEAVEVSGNTCPRGEAYARKEVTHPTRIVTSTMKVTGAKRPVISCKTASDIPKESIFKVMEAINEAAAEAPVGIGDVLIKNVANLGVDIVATAGAECLLV